MKSQEYWKERSLEDKKRSINLSETFINREVKRQYKRALTDFQEALNKLYQEFADSEHVTLAEAKRRLNGKDLNVAELDALEQMLKENRKVLKEKRDRMPGDIVAAMEKRHMAMEAQLKRLSRKGYMNHLELCEMQMQNVVLHLADQQQITMYDMLESQYRDGYFRGIYDTQKGLEIGFDFTAPDERAVRRAVMNSWSKKNFSDLIWGHEKQLAKELRDAMTVGLIRGDSIEQMTKRVTDRLDVSASNARRLVRTESAHIHEQAAMDAYRECGITKYQFLATLDRRTSEQCRKLDGKVLELADAQVGVNYPPIHPNCRSTTVPQPGTEATRRIARGADGKTYQVTGNTTYEEWYRELSEDERGKMSAMNRADRKRSSDKEQLKRIRNTLGRDTPSIAEYQQMKYNEPEKYRFFKGYVRAVQKGDISPLIGRKQYDQIAQEATRELVGIELPGIGKTTRCSTHFIDRIIGQREAPATKGVRLGVPIADIKESLVNPVEIKPIRTRKDGKRSQQFIGQICTVTVDPDDGTLIQVQPGGKS